MADEIQCTTSLVRHLPIISTEDTTVSRQSLSLQRNDLQAYFNLYKEHKKLNKTSATCTPASQTSNPDSCVSVHRGLQQKPLRANTIISAIHSIINLRRHRGNSNSWLNPSHEGGISFVHVS